MDQAKCPLRRRILPGGTGSASPPAAAGAPTRTNTELARRDLAVTDLVTCARNGDKQSWDALVERYAPLIWSICRRYRLNSADAEDISQNVWLLLVNHLDKIHDPAALPGWLATVTRRECLHVLGATRRPWRPVT